MKYTPNHTRQENSRANLIREEQNAAEPNHTVCQKRGRKTRTRKITWFKASFSMKVATNFRKNFFLILNECFPKNNKLHKIFNGNTLKLNSSCMTNLKQNIEKQVPEEFTRPCKTSCPFKGKCLLERVAYKAIVTQTESRKQDTYMGMAENHFNFFFYYS